MVAVINDNDNYVYNYKNYYYETNEEVTGINYSEEDNAFTTLGAEYENSETNEDFETEINSVEDLKEEYEKIQKEQGIVGKAFDAIKNKFSFLSKIGCKGSDEITEVIAKAESGEITLEEAEEELNKYEKNQENVTNTVLNTATIGVVSAVLLLSGPLGWGVGATIGIACATGVAARVGLGAVEAATNDVEGDYTSEDIKDDAKTGFLLGLLSGFNKVFHTRFSKKQVDNQQKLNDKITEKIKGIFSDLTVTA